MARPLSWQLDIAAYPFSVAVPPRYSDLDPMHHINNVAIAGMFETGRIAFHHQLSAHPSEMRVRWLVAAVSINYLEEMHFPHDVTIASGFLRVGKTSWTVLSAAFQDGIAHATCETVVVAQGPEGRRSITEQVRAEMAPFFVKAPADAGV